MNCRILCAMIALGLWAPAGFGQQAAPAPMLPPGVEIEPYYGDDRCVALLGELLTGPDLTARQRAAIELGQTRNIKALPLLAQAARDSQAPLVCAAIQASADFPTAQSADIVLLGLRSDTPAVQLAALDSARRLALRSGVDDIRKLASSPDAFVASAAIETLTHLGASLPGAALATLLDHASPAVRLRAAQNASLAKADATLGAKLMALARNGEPAIRGEALASAGKLTPGPVAPLLPKAAQDPSPLVRRGAVQAWLAGRSAQPIRERLSDESPLVRLAAIAAVAELKDADAVESLLPLMLETPTPAQHQAARQALVAIATPAVTAAMARVLAEADPKTPAPRNARSAAAVLGQLKSNAALPRMLELVGELGVDSPILTDVALALGKIGEPQAIAPLQAKLKLATKNGREYLAASAAGRAGPPYSDETTSALITALADLQASQALPDILAVIDVQTAGQRLGAAQAAARELRKFPTPPADKLAAALNKILADEGFGLPCQFEACVTAGQLKLAPTAAAMGRLLNDVRPGPYVMDAAAWALAQITGARPAVPAPRTKLGPWIVRPS